jgi:hypothetical protein
MSHCRLCNDKITRDNDPTIQENVHGTDLCYPCYEACGLENEHNDHHDPANPHDDCEHCHPPASEEPGLLAAIVERELQLDRLAAQMKRVKSELRLLKKTQNLLK